MRKSRTNRSIIQRHKKIKKEVIERASGRRNANVQRHTREKLIMFLGGLSFIEIIMGVRLRESFV